MADEDPEPSGLREAAWLTLKEHPRPPLIFLLLVAVAELSAQEDADERFDSAFGFALAIIGAMYGA